MNDLSESVLTTPLLAAIPYEQSDTACLRRARSCSLSTCDLRDPSPGLVTERSRVRLSLVVRARISGATGIRDGPFGWRPLAGVRPMGRSLDGCWAGLGLMRALIDVDEAGPCRERFVLLCFVVPPTGFEVGDRTPPPIDSKSIHDKTCGCS